MNFYRSKALHYILFRLHIISFNDYCKSVKKTFSGTEEGIVTVSATGTGYNSSQNVKS